MNYYLITPSPLGDVTIQANDDGLLGLWFEEHTTLPDVLGSLAPEHPILVEASKQLTSYFEGKVQSFDLPLAAEGTDFQKLVWRALCDIPFGESISYQELANRIGKPKAVRAVGAANGKNPISVIVPCHRVIGKSGTLTGYAGGVERKKKLLELEGIKL
ncbi:methylated-DNA--[protein]-cysteine S-methyltransferase [Vibrio barjaei]|jgi:methylated-DNA-[protein]-cysteine S-methyltransferase|uniref:methylated-DNA--[protein]-cysteine S-methyltransferase n=1 Tax=Vibrio barjaei TaxID=1676683 RepID=UPI00228441D6|nr:methylated-DNA--[protein]-cysteine S-methyltransferase [Vibrio barjaei]MCG9789910.1 methylated-DNA--[protein]-cysteine S-methyltransferase [Vibrio mediterranei]MCY9869957.1 methylated-DNA--[protein]-cysteine S-methyltransferase [Vibrio barjaei]